MSLDNLDRRTILGGMLALACSLCLPKVLWGAGTAQRPPAAQQPEAAQQAGKAKGGKVSKEQVKYQEKPKGDQKCSNCINFIEPDSCKLVAGKINPNGWCILWAKKRA